MSQNIPLYLYIHKLTPVTRRDDAETTDFSCYDPKTPYSGLQIEATVTVPYHTTYHTTETRHLIISTCLRSKLGFTHGVSNASGAAVAEAARQDQRAARA